MRNILFLICITIPAINARAQTFTDISSRLSNQDGTLHNAWGASLVDVDGNGLVDLYEPHILLLQQDDGTFESSLEDFGIPIKIIDNGSFTFPEWGRSIFGSVFADVNDDGFPEMFVMDLSSDSSHFYQNIAGLGLEEKTGSNGIVIDGLGQGSVFADFNLDGYLDLFFGEEKGHNQLFLGDGSGGFTESTSLAGIDSSVQVYGVAAADYDNDGDLDIFIAACAPDPKKSINLLFRNKGDGTFEEVGEAAGINDDRNGWGVNWLDYDRDGFMDVFVANMTNDPNRTAKNTLYRNNGDGTFTDVAFTVGVDGNETKLSFGSSVADFNNDGWMDIWVANLAAPPQLYVNNGDGTYTERFSTIGIPFINGALSVSVADVNADGWIDLFIGADRSDQFSFFSMLLENDGGLNGFITVDLIQEAPNKRGIGARIEVWNEGVVQLRDITAGDGFTSQNMNFSAHFGIGDTASVDSLVIKWPDGTRDRLENVQRDQHLHIQKGGMFNRPPSTFWAGEPVTTKSGEWRFGWTESVDPEGADIQYVVNVKGPAGNLVFESAPTSDLGMSAEIDTTGFGDTGFTWAVTATDGLHVLRSVNSQSHLTSINASVESADIPIRLNLDAPYPNPTMATLFVSVELHDAGYLRMEVLDVLGRKVLEEDRGFSGAGKRIERLNTDVLSAGTYLLRTWLDESPTSRTFVVVR